MNSIFTETPKLHYHEDPPSILTEEFIKVVESRRSIRKFTAEEIPDPIVNQCLDLALLAPNSSNLQPWEFYWVKTPSIKNKLAEFCFSQPAATTAPVLIVCVARTKRWQLIQKKMLSHFDQLPEKTPKAVWDYYEKLVPLAYYQGPFGIVGFLKKIIFTVIGIFKVVPREPSSLADMRTWAVKTTALACENLMLAFRAYGYDTCPMEGIDSCRIRRLLKLPCDSVITMVISAGKREQGGVYGKRIRFERDLFIKTI